MKEPKSLKILSPEEIIIDNPWIFWKEQGEKKFLQNLKKMGQLEPVLVIWQKENYFLVHGYKRVLALKKLGKKVLALEIEKTSPKTLGLIYFLLNAEKRSEYHLVKALRFFSAADSTLAKEEWALLGLNPKSPFWDHLHFWLTLPEYWDDLLLQGHLEISQVPWLSQFSTEELEFFYPFWQRIKWTKSNLRTLLTLSLELKAKGLLGAQLKQELTLFLEKKLSPQDLQTSLLQHLRKLRYPTLTLAQEKLARYLTEISKGSGWKIQHPYHLETPGLILQTQVNNAEELNQAIQELKNIQKQNPWRKWEDFLHA